MVSNYRYYLPLMAILLSSCIKNDFVEDDTDSQTQGEIEISDLEMTELKIPNGFDFSTRQQVSISINDTGQNVKYDVYAYNDALIDLGPVTYENEEGETVTENEFRSDVLNQLLFSGSPYSGKLNHTITLPSYYTQLYVRRKENSVYSSVILDINDGNVSYTHTHNSISNKAAKAGVDDYLYCVNGSAQLFQVNPLDGTLTEISNMPMGSYTCAIDQGNKILYSIGKSSPYPLMKYSIENDTWETVTNLGRGGPRLDYNSQDGLLYFSTKNKLYSYDPLNGNLLSTWTIMGLDSTSGGDLAFDEDGNLYVCTFSGLYRLELESGGDYQATRISADNLPFRPTSMTFDSNQELWLANNASSSDLIIMDTQTGGWQYNYGISASNNSDYGRTINDLTTFRIFSENKEEVDTDGDGILDPDDSFPDDADKAFEVFTPSKYGYGTLAFEDHWPAYGDYDFNDMAVNYKIIAIQNSANEVVQVDFSIVVKNNGASFVNALGIEFENLSPSQVESVTGTVLTQGYINLNANGTEAQQENAVIILYDNNYAMVDNPITVSVKLSTPLTTSELGNAPFNPFMIINKIRAREVHLPFAHTTSLGGGDFSANGINRDGDGNYVTDEGLPWGINIIHNFKVPKEKVAINKAYNHFNTWVTSGGTSYPDWYKDSAGYRNVDKIVD